MTTNNKGSRGGAARGFAGLFAVLAMGLGAMTSPAEAAPFAYVTNAGDNTVSVIDTATNPPSVVATVTAGVSGRSAVAVTPDGKHVYVANPGATPIDGTVLVIDTATNTVVATIPMGSFPSGVAVTPDGKHAYVTNFGFSSNVSVIDTAINMVVATVTVENSPTAVAITPDGKHAYVTTGDVAVIDRHGHEYGGGHDPGGE